MKITAEFFIAGDEWQYLFNHAFRRHGLWKASCTECGAKDLPNKIFLPKPCIFHKTSNKLRKLMENPDKNAREIAVVKKYMELMFGTNLDNHPRGFTQKEHIVVYNLTGCETSDVGIIVSALKGHAFVLYGGPVHIMVVYSNIMHVILKDTDTKLISLPFYENGLLCIFREIRFHLGFQSVLTFEKTEDNHYERFKTEPAAAINEQSDAFSYWNFEMPVLYHLGEYKMYNGEKGPIREVLDSVSFHNNSLLTMCLFVFKIHECFEHGMCSSFVAETIFEIMEMESALECMFPECDEINLKWKSRPRLLPAPV